MKKVGLIDYFLHEWHADHIKEWVKKASNGIYDVVYAWGEIDSPRPNGLTNSEWAKEHDIQLCSTQEELIEKSDCLCVMAPDNIETHERLCDLALKSGKPAYIDKAIAINKKAAVNIIDLANKYNTPCFASSALRFASEYQNAKKDGICGILTSGGGSCENYIIHQIEPIVMFAGSNPKRVKSVGNNDFIGFVLEFHNGIQARINFFNDDYPFEMGIKYNDKTSASIKVESDMFANFTKELIRFFDTGEIIVPHEQSLAVVSIIESCMTALKQNDWVKIL